MSYELLEKILTRVGKLEIIDTIWNDILWQKEITNDILSHSTLVEEVSILSKEEFENFPVYVSILTEAVDISYTYDEYLEHIKLSESFASTNENYSFVQDITINDGCKKIGRQVHFRQGNR